MHPYQLLKLHLLFQNRPSRLLSFPLPPSSLSPLTLTLTLTLTFLPILLPPSPHHRRLPQQPRNIILLPLILPPLIPHMIDPQHAPQNRRPAEIIHRQIGAPLVLVLQEGETPAFARFFVPH